MEYHTFICTRHLLISIAEHGYTIIYYLDIHSIIYYSDILSMSHRHDLTSFKKNKNIKYLKFKFVKNSRNKSLSQ